ncbi:hypothetical protein H0262_11190 [Psychrobacter cryohalolentis]|uniref:hypothetical protein n=1 Tax=Psychrobacter sp. D2 TaxID=2759702 RepID=UPI0015E60B1F|nr:hypothetical protein [Psychrobacter sp. D2]MBA2058437.1 hypothetical protein [Psychrobacter sp. D2]
MKNFKLRTRYRTVEVDKTELGNSRVILTFIIHGTPVYTIYHLLPIHHEKLISYTSLPLLLAYARRNRIGSKSRSYPKNNQDTSIREETLCPCPPETSSLEVGGGILARHELLKESVPVCECGSTFFRDDLGSCYDCFFPSDDRGE